MKPSVELYREPRNAGAGDRIEEELENGPGYLGFSIVDDCDCCRSASLRLSLVTSDVLKPSMKQIV